MDVGKHTEQAIFSTILSLLLADQILDTKIPHVYQVPSSVFSSGLHSDPRYIPIPITFRFLLHSDPRIKNLPLDRNVTGIGM